MPGKQFISEQIIRHLCQVVTSPAVHRAKDHRLNKPIVSDQDEKAHSKTIHHHQGSVPKCKQLTLRGYLLYAGLT